MQKQDPQVNKLQIWIIKSVDLAVEIYSKLGFPINNIPYLLIINECYDRIKASNSKESNQSLKVLAEKILSDISPGDSKSKN